MARPREFDIDEALDNAMAVFWRKGYDGTSLPDLLDGMQITRGSFYKAFADKRSVYLSCLDRYDRAVISEAVTRLTDDARGDGRSRIAAFFNAVAAGGRTDRRGCFLCNAATERAPFDAEVEVKVAAMTERLRAAFAVAARQAGKKVLALNIGQPDIPSPREMLDRLKQPLSDTPAAELA